jgi:long-chain acyl-CoA synthetase
MLTGSAVVDTFPKILLAHARTRPTEVAMREKDLGIWQSWSWQAVAENVRDLACGLRALGLRRGDNLAIIGDNRPQLYRAMAAAQALGAVPVPLYQDAVADEMIYILCDADIRYAVVEDQEQVDKLLEIEARLPALQAIV